MEARRGASREGLEIYRELAAQNRDAFLPDLASSLGNLGNRLSELGRREEALEATREGLEIYRELAAQNRDAFLPALASSLGNLGNMLSDLGRRILTLRVDHEIEALHRRLSLKQLLVRKTGGRSYLHAFVRTLTESAGAALRGLPHEIYERSKIDWDEIELGKVSKHLRMNYPLRVHPLWEDV